MSQKQNKNSVLEQAVVLIVTSIFKIIGLVIFLITLPIATINNKLYDSIIAYELAKAQERKKFKANAKELRKKGVKATSGVSLNYEM